MKAPLHKHYMFQSLSLAKINLGATGLNPSVGCVVVDSGGAVVGVGATCEGGRPHAETQALAMAGAAASGGTIYVSLEPCAHEGETPPCTQAIIAAGVREVFYAVRDPDPRTAGQGAAQLEAAGIKTHHGLLEQEARNLNLGFFTRITKQRASVTLKLAMSKNGFMRTPDGESNWITNPLSQRYGHLLRAQHNAIIVGRGTWEEDSPQLNCRLSGLEHRSPKRVIMSRTPLSASADILVSDAPPLALLQDLAANHGVNAVLLEGGATLAKAFVEADLVDAIALFEAPHEVRPPPLDSALQISKADAEFIGWRESDFTCSNDFKLNEDRLRFFYKNGKA